MSLVALYNYVFSKVVSTRNGVKIAGNISIIATTSMEARTYLR